MKLVLIYVVKDYIRIRLSWGRHFYWQKYFC